MENRMKQGEWSVVMTAASDNKMKIGELSQEQRGLDISSLTWFAAKHLPAEIYTELPFEYAQDLVSQLSNTGAVFEIKRTSELSGLKHKASEVWASRCAGNYCFTELDGVISRLGPLNTRENIDRLRETNPNGATWAMERYINHIHVDIANSDDECIEAGEQAIAQLIEALRQAYPDRAFTVSHIPGSIVSFWQTTPDSPKEDCLPCENDTHPGKAWCRNCRKYRGFHASSRKESKFKAEWGCCVECGQEILVAPCEKLTFIYQA